VDSYRLRFQSELNFRDAKQYWGLEDFMHVTPTGVTKAAHLSLFMVNVAYRLQADVRQRDPAYSIPGLASGLSRLQIRGGDDTKASGKT
jgi:putative transposase